MTAPIDAAELRARRYGERPRSRRPFVVVVVLCAVLGLAAIVWVSSGLVQARPEGEAPAFDVVSDAEVQVRLEVTRPAGTAATCTIEAIGNGFGQVGLLDVVIPPSQQQVALLTVSLATSERANAVVVRECRVPA